MRELSINTTSPQRLMDSPTVTRIGVEAVGNTADNVDRTAWL